MTGVLLTKSTTFIIGPVATVLGWLMDAIFNFLSSAFDIQNIGLSIIIFTIIIYVVMIPLNYNQQKFQKLSSVMQPELQKVQKKYKDKKDQASVQKMQEEQKLIYEKYGSSPTGGCMQLLIQMPILFGLYQVIQKIPAYVETVKEAYLPLISELQTLDYQTTMETIGEAKPIYVDASKYDYTEVNTLVDVLYKFQSDTWTTFQDAFPELESLILTTKEAVAEYNVFLGLDIGNSPWLIMKENYSTNLLVAFAALCIPILAGLSQYVSIKISQAGQKQQIDPDNPMASSLNSMTTTMPLLSVFMCFSFASGIGIYWITSAVVRTIQQVIIKKYLDNKPLDEMIEKNREKAAKKREKKGTNAARLNEMAQTNTKKLEITKEEREELLKKASEKNSNAKAGSLASRANMVKDYNEGKK